MAKLKRKSRVAGTDPVPANSNTNFINWIPTPDTEEGIEEDPVPEPGTLLLLGSGLVGIAGYGKLRFRRRKK